MIAIWCELSQSFARSTPFLEFPAYEAGEADCNSSKSVEEGNDSA